MVSFRSSPAPSVRRMVPYPYLGCFTRVPRAQPPGDFFPGAGFASGGADVRLEDADGGTKLSYDVDAQVGGKLAMLGSRLIDSTARSMATQFFEKFAEVVSAMKPEKAAAPAKAAKKAAPKKAAKKKR